RLLVDLQVAHVLPVGGGQVAVERETLFQQQREHLLAEQIEDAARDQLEDLRLEHIDARVGRIGKDDLAFRFLQKARDAAVLVHQDDTVLAGVVHQGEGDGRQRVLVFVRANEARQVHVGQVVAADDDERVVPEKIFDALDASGIAPQPVLMRPVDFDAPSGAVAKIVFDLIAEVVQVHHDLVEAVPLQQLHQILHDRAIDDGNERFGNVAGQRVEAGTDTGGQYHRFHIDRYSWI